MHRTSSQEWLLRVAGVIALSGVTIGCNQSGAPVQPSGSRLHDHTAGAASRSNVDGIQIGSNLADVRRATVGFHDIASAFSAGYTIEHEPCVPGMGVHARNEPLMGDQVIDPFKPELLLYEPTPDGGHRLMGVEYFQVVLVRDGDPTTDDAPRPWFGTTKWPSDWEVVTPTPQLFGQPFDPEHAGHIPQMPWHWDLHVWIWQANSDGLFAPFNPAVRCPS